MVSNRSMAVLLHPRDHPARYAERYARGEAPDRFPYGAEHAPPGWLLAPTSATLGGPIIRLLTGVSRVLLRTDAVTAWRSRRALRSADYVYAHLDAESLGAALLRVLPGGGPRVLAHLIWLPHDYPSLSRWHRWWIDRMIARVDIVLYNARPNYELGRALWPRARHAFVPFGVSTLFADAGRDQQVRGDLVLTVGNDRARDWSTFREALASIGGDLPVRVATSASSLGLPPSAQVEPTVSVDELIDLYRSARVVVVPLTENSHASGITTMIEAALCGAPIISSAVGGLACYFPEHVVRYVPPGDPEALAEAIREAVSGQLDHLGPAAREWALDQGLDNAHYWVRVTDLLPPMPAATGAMP